MNMSKSLVKYVMYGVSILMWLVLLNHIFGMVAMPGFVLPMVIIVAVVLFFIKMMMVRKESREQ
jgi:hypothetical protein